MFTCILMFCCLAGERLGLVRGRLAAGQLLQEGVHRHLAAFYFLLQKPLFSVEYSTRPANNSSGYRMFVSVFSNVSHENLK
jgi:hypothetical protein